MQGAVGKTYVPKDVALFEEAAVLFAEASYSAMDVEAGERGTLQLTDFTTADAVAMWWMAKLVRGLSLPIPRL